MSLCGIGMIRLILAIAVVMAHSSSFLGYYPIDGMTSVQIFYIISGFYMFMILTEKYTSLRKFYKARALKIYPAYLAILILTIPIWISTNAFSSFDSLSIKALVTLVLTNIILIGQDVVMFLGISPETGNLFFTENFREVATPAYRCLLVPQAWTLGLELTFYLLVPFLVKRPTKFLIILVSISIIFRIIFAHNI